MAIDTGGRVRSRVLVASNPVSFARDYLLQIRTFLRCSRANPVMVASFGMVASFRWAS